MVQSLENPEEALQELVNSGELELSVDDEGVFIGTVFIIFFGMHKEEFKIPYSLDKNDEGKFTGTITLEDDSVYLKKLHPDIVQAMNDYCTELRRQRNES